MITFPTVFLFWSLIIIFLAFGIPALFVPKKLTSALQKIMKNEETLRLGGFFVFIIALLFFMVRYAFTGTWYVIFSILGVLSLIKGFALIRFPKFGATRGNIFYSKKALTMLVGLFLVLLAVYFILITVK